MIDLNAWPYRWFGFWYEYGPRYANCPRIRECIRHEVAATYNLVGLRKYMTTATDLGVTSRLAFPDAVTGELRAGSIAVMTDGLWVWMSDLPDYIEKYGVAIPNAWLVQIQAHFYVPPQVLTSSIEQLEYPPIVQV